ncbi:YbhB/YbcL family Raf kinase inhibitor-like protein [Candidatus Roizmanbacteria bacterium]|nr:YbhB/YbcL family Raf kinase inhibitor-like protein [Candidatus Roizmanbacteria bacterium]
MDLTSDSFENNQTIPSPYTCDGEGINPPLSIGGIPEETESLALTVTDPDAPAGTWTHWVVFNIPPDTDEIDEDSVPDNSLQGVNDSGNMKYGPPCPPSGEHRYVFHVYALDTMLDLPAGADREALESAMEGHILEQAQLVGNYSRE